MRNTNTNTNMRKGFTMIELIFVIVIIGILAAVAIPKLSATRDDAEVSKAVMDLGTCISDAGAFATAKKIPTPAQVAAIPSCQKVNNDEVFAVSFITTDKNLTIANGISGDSWAAPAQTRAGTTATGGMIGVHTFGGQGVEY